MNLITSNYLALQKEMYARTGDYGRAGDRWLAFVLKILDREGPKTVLDYGCGRGSLVYSLQAADIDAHGYDPAMPPYEQMPVPAQLVTCTDVMEHIEPECLFDVLSHLQTLTLERLFVVVSLRPAGKRLRDGRNAHLIIQNSHWWSTLFSQFFKVDRVHKSDGQEWIAELTRR
jgi:hypothetical protein